MAQVNIVVNGRNYSVGCGDGEEAHLRSLAEYLDSRVQEIAGQVGQVGDSRLFLLAGLMVADDMAETMEQLDSLRAELAAIKAARNEHEGVRLDDLTRRLEDIAGRLENA